MMNEGDVLQAVRRYLEKKGYAVTQVRTPRQRGVDLEATHKQTGQRLLVEAKGATSSDESSARYGREFDSTQARTHIAKAFYQATVLSLKKSPGKPNVAIALPETQRHVELIEKVLPALRRLGIGVLIVDNKSKIQVLLTPSRGL